MNRRNKKRVSAHAEDAAELAGALTPRDKDELAVMLLIEEWRYFVEVADNYERRVAQILLPAAVAAFAAVFSINWATGYFDLNDDSSIDVGLLGFDFSMPVPSIVFLVLLVLFIELAIFGVIYWMATNFRREAVAEVYLMEIEAKLNVLLAKPNLSNWMATYCHNYISPKGMSKRKDPLFPAWWIMVATAAVLILLVTGIIMSRIGFWYGFVNFVLFASIMVYFAPSFENNSIRDEGEARSAKISSVLECSKSS